VGAGALLARAKGSRVLAARLPKPPPLSVDGPISVVRKRAAEPASEPVLEVGEERPLSPGELALACREAGLAFLDGVATGWGKLDLVEWLEEAYRPLTVDARDESNLGPESSGPVATDTLDRIMQRAHDAVIASLVRLADGDWEAVMRAMQREHVVSTRIADALVWVPADRARMSLEARVLSLFLADYLVADTHFDDLRVAPCCSAVSFEKDGSDAPCHCRRAARPSHIRDLAPR